MIIPTLLTTDILAIGVMLFSLYTPRPITHFVQLCISFSPTSYHSFYSTVHFILSHVLSLICANVQNAK